MISGYTFYKSDFTIRVVVSSAMNNYGSLTLVTDPVPNSNPTTPSLWSLGCNPWYHMPISSCKTFCFDIPFISNYSREIVADLFTVQRLYVFVQNPLFNTMGDVSNATVQIFASLKNPTFHYPNDYQTPLVSFSDKDDDLDIELHSNSEPSLSEAIQKASSGMLLSSQTKRAVQKGAVRFISTVAVNTLMATMGKPDSVATNVVQSTTLRNFCHGQGSSYSTVLGLTPEQTVCNDYRKCSDTKDYMNFKNLACKPTFYKVLTFQSTTGDSIVAHMTPISNTSVGQNVCLVDYVANLHRHYRGGLKHILYVVAPPQVQARFVIYFTPSGGACDWQNCEHKVYDICGDTKIELRTPYMGCKFRDTIPSSTAATIRIAQISRSTPVNSVDNPIYFNVFRAASEDMCFYDPVDTFYPESHIETDFANMIMMDDKYKHYTFENFYTPESEDLSTLCRKPAIATSVNLNATKSYSSSVFRYGPNMCTFEQFGRLFRFYSGSVTYDIISKNKTMKVATVEGSSYNFGAYAIATSDTPNLSFTVPYAHMGSFSSTRSDSVTTVRVTLSDPQGFLVFKSAGDDFHYYFPCVPTFLPSRTGANTNNYKLTDWTLNPSI